MRREKGLKPVEPAKVESHPQLQIHDEDPDVDGCLELLLRNDSVRFRVIRNGEHEMFALSVHVTSVDFAAIVEHARAHVFEAEATASPALKEGPLLLIMGDGHDKSNYVEIWLGHKYARISVSAINRDGASLEQSVCIAPASFTALIERCRTHKFEGR